MGREASEASADPAQSVRPTSAEASEASAGPVLTPFAPKDAPTAPEQPEQPAPLAIPVPATASLPAATVVPGCHAPRPADLDLPDGAWRALESIGMADDPLVLAALKIFGPGVRVIAAEAGDQ